MYGVVVADFESGESKIIDPTGIIDIDVNEVIWGVGSLNKLDFKQIKIK